MLTMPTMSTTPPSPRFFVARSPVARFFVSCFALLALLALLAPKPLAAQQPAATPAVENRTVAVGTFNIAWLGDGKDDREPREEADYKRVAEVIRDAAPDVLGLEEIENPAALQRVLRYLPDYKFVLGTGGGEQNLGVLYKSTVSVQFLEEYKPLAVDSARTRPGVMVRCKAGNFDWIMMVVHLKSSSRFDSTAELKDRARLWRTKQAETLAAWAQTILKTDKEKEQDVMILGDFNDYPTNEKYPTLQPLLAQTNYRFLTFDLLSCKKPTQPQQKAWKAIDHIVASESAQRRLVRGSILTIDFHSQYPEAQANKVSDHCPVVCRFNTSAPDND
jgi:endonuclease/exonuclease/phosphatase family metal-dependent hydrolase